MTGPDPVLAPGSSSQLGQIALLIYIKVFDYHYYHYTFCINSVNPFWILFSIFCVTRDAWGEEIVGLAILRRTQAINTTWQYENGAHVMGKHG
jgi:hypothetical protein